MCGVLFITFQKPESTQGRYLVCALFRHFLILASANKHNSRLRLVASIALRNTIVESADSGRGKMIENVHCGAIDPKTGIQCHNAPYTWKLSFEHDRNIYGILMTACSAAEEDAWKGNMRTRIREESRDSSAEWWPLDGALNVLNMNFKTVAPIFDQRGESSNEKSIQRAVTVGSATNITRVIIQNTQAQKLNDNDQNVAAVAMGRSHTLLSTKNTPIVAPRRTTRIRLEMVLSDVWTKDVLPYPGMLYRRNENSIRASANMMMRKFSMASFTSGFSKRSASFTSLSHSRTTNECSASSRLAPKSSVPMLRKSNRPLGMRCSTAPVDFHNAPEAFLPEDFGIQGNSSSTKRPAFRRSITDNEEIKSPLKENSSVSDIMQTGSLPSRNFRTSKENMRKSINHKNTRGKAIVSVDGPSDEVTSTRDTAMGASTPSSVKVSKRKKKLFKFW